MDTTCVIPHSYYKKIYNTNSYVMLREVYSLTTWHNAHFERLRATEVQDMRQGHRKMDILGERPSINMWCSIVWRTRNFYWWNDCRICIAY